MKKISAALTCVLLLAGCGWLTSTRYAAEVGYYAGTEIAWDLWGDFESLEECRDAAISRYNFYVNQNSRAYTWSCLSKDGSGGYTERFR